MKRLTINGVNIWDEYGILMVRNSYDSIVSYPTAKAPYTNDWYEFNGVETLKNTLKFNTQEVKLNFAMTRNDVAIFYDFIEFLTESQKDKGYLEITNVLQRLYVDYLHLTLQKSSQLRNIVNPFLFTLDFEMNETPILRNTINKTLNPQAIITHYTINGIDFGRYNCAVLKGTNEQFLKFSELKFGVAHSSNYYDFKIYETQLNNKRSAKRATMYLLMRAESADDFWGRYELLRDVLQGVRGNSELDIYNENIGEFTAIYESCETTKFLFTQDEPHVAAENYWWQFRLNFNITNWKVGSDLSGFILGTEDNRAVTTEDGFFLHITL